MPERGDATGAAAWLHRSVKEVYRDETLWVLDKPAGVLSHPNPPARQAPNAIFRAPYDGKRECYHAAGGGPRHHEVFLVHRLDQETSGLILCTFRDDAAALLKEALFHREIKKEYRALVLGVPQESRGEWNDHLEKVPHPGRVTVRACKGAANAVTLFSVLERIEPAGLSVLALWPQTGRTHQLRVQAARRGHPIAGDDRYGDFTANRFLAAEAGLKYMFLHALRIELRHPVTGHVLKLLAPMGSRLTIPLEKARALTIPVLRRALSR